LVYAAQGKPVFPLRRGGKTPHSKLAPHSFYNATTDPAVIREWWHKVPDANIGIPTGTPSGWVVIDTDLDAEKGLDGEEALRELEKTHGPLPKTVMQMTPRGGYHRVFRDPGGIKCSTSKIGKGIDMRAAGGYVAVPPGTRRDGKYVWEVDHHPDDIEPAELPAWIRLLRGNGSRKAKTRDKSKAKEKPKSSDTGSIPKGKRNDTLCRIGGSLRHKGHEEQAIFTALLEVNNNRCKPPLPDDEVERIAHSLTKYEPNPDAGHPYSIRDHALYFTKFMKDGTCVDIKLANYIAHIISNLKEDDGQEIRHLFEIEVSQPTKTTTVTVPANQFAKMEWPVEALGAGAIITPGPLLRDHLRAAVQYLSADTLVERTVYAHTGWRNIGGEWVYLHAAGGTGAHGLVDTVETNLPTQLQLYTLPAPPTGEELIACIKASLGFLDCAPPKITTPLFAAPFCVVVSPIDFSEHLCGQTGVFKTELAAMVQQFFGLGLDARHLPGSFSSTANATEALAFAAKDSILVVDDFAPNGSAVDVQRLHSAADRILRGQGNKSGRSRMRADGGFRAPKHPRGMILTTGEDTPVGESLQARILAIEIAKGDVDIKKLTGCQADAAAGKYARTMSAYVSWLASQYNEIKKQIKQETDELRAKAIQASHARTPGIVASLALGLRYFLSFAVESKAITAERKKELEMEFWNALIDVGKDQAQFQAHSDPAGRFVQLLTAAIATGKAHVATKEGGEPDDAAAWGWQEDWKAETTRGQISGYRCCGTRVGWIDGSDVFLEPESSFLVAQTLARGQGSSLPITARTLHKRLHDHGFLASCDSARQTLTIRRIVEKRKIAVLHFHVSTFTGSNDSETSVASDDDE